MADKALNQAVANLDNSIWDHRWGYKDTQLMIHPDMTVEMTGSRYKLCGYRMPYLIPFARDAFGLEVDFSSKRPLSNPPAPAPRRNEDFSAAIAQVLPPARISEDDRERRLHSHGQTTVDEVTRVLYGELERLVDLVVWPETDAECAMLVALAGIHDICLIPYGGGTNVSNALLVPKNETRTVVSVDMRRMNRIEWIDKVNFRACVQAGILGSDLEAQLEKEGLTCGHEPDSVELSTLGGWISTNASGMKKNRYGNIEDIVENVTLVTPSGVIEQVHSFPRVSMGTPLQKSLFGSEGNYGLITRAVIRIRPLPEAKKYGAIVFKDFKTGVDFLYELNQTGVIPASIRLVDNIQFRLSQALKPAPEGAGVLMDKVQKFVVLNVKNFDPHEMVAATIVMEGTAEQVEHQEKIIGRLAKKYGGLQGGSENGQRGYMLTYAIAYLRDLLADYYILAETYETTAPWDKIHDVCGAVARTVNEEHKRYGFPGRPFSSPRVTQLYPTGVCIYFTHAIYFRGVEGAEEKFADMERKLRVEIMAAGGSLSHHHGIGKLRADFMPQTMTPATTKAIHDFKSSVDPQNVFGAANNVLASNESTNNVPTSSVPAGNMISE